MRDILLINPNSSEATTTMMVRIATAELPPVDGFRVTGLTALRGPSMIVNEAELSAAGLEVERSWRDAGTAWDGIIISAFGDPGIERVRRLSPVPVVGICEASMLEAAHGSRRFGVATVTPDLAAAIDGRAAELGLSAHYSGIRLTEGDPRALAADPAALDEALAAAVQKCIDEDGAQAVIIGGGPLGQAAMNLSGRFGSVALIAPIPAAVRRLRMLMLRRQSVGAASKAGASL
ncbi:aspartate/glutamate racemase family protein [Variovorax sp. J22R133]|uniref:aspartate/glutamate racemase family protein n=1 Tax=Variovorax brevis TaxID=3053503 RepID=UPI0025779067|nr:aspartate/glutamate racemase family protein [Variovorax sp. J22R133]MDM0114149.1 aspartate/glutamate racemase family protein [Variovorax sp. J22R133]